MKRLHKKIPTAQILRSALVGAALFGFTLNSGAVFAKNLPPAQAELSAEENAARREDDQSRERETMFDYRPVAPVLHTLKNGLQLVIIPDHRSPVISHTVWYRVGGSDEPKGQSGVAHFLEHLMFRGTKTMAPGAFSKRIAELGGEDNAFTTRDFTAYYQNVASEHLETVMMMEADRMRNLQLTDSDVARERDVVIEERKMRVDNNPSAKMIEEIHAVLYRNHPYGSPVIGWQHEIKALNSQAAREFYKQFYAPNNALVTIVGDVKPAKAIALAEKTYGKNQANPKIARIERPAEPPQISARTITIRDEKVENPSLYLAFQAFSPLRETKKYNALSVALQAFGGGASSYLYQELAEKKGLALYVAAQQGDFGVDQGTVYVRAAPAPGVSVQKLRREIMKAQAEFIKNGFTAKAIERAKKNMIADFIGITDSRGTVANLWGETLLLTGKPDRILHYPRDIQKVTVEEAKAAFQAVMNPDQAVTGYLLPPAPKKP